MARTRQQQQAARAAARQWRRVELRRLLGAWERVLRYPQTHYETSDELEHRVYSRFQLLATTQRTTEATDAQPAPAPRSASDVTQMMLRLKRSFLFITAYNQTRCSSPSAPADPHTSARPSETLHSSSTLTAATTHGRSWFDLQPQERNSALQATTRERRAAPYIDMDRAMYRAMQKIMTHTFAQLERRRRSRSPSNSEDAHADDHEAPAAAAPVDSDLPVLLLHTPATVPWSSLEVRRLLHAWHETIADPHRARVHSDTYLTALYDRFVDSCDGTTPRCSAAVRTKKTALMRFGALVRDLGARTVSHVDWVALAPEQRTQLLTELGYVCESADALDPALFALLQHNLALEDDAYSDATAAIAGATTDAARAARPVRVALGQDVSNAMQSRVSDTPQRRDARVGSCDCGKHSTSSAVEKPQRSRRKRLRVDTDLFVVLDILECEATRLREVLQSSAAARASEQRERERLEQALQREQDAHARAAAAWQAERAALQDELAQLRKRALPGLVRWRAASGTESRPTDD